MNSLDKLAALSANTQKKWKAYCRRSKTHCGDVSVARYHRTYLDAAEAERRCETELGIPWESSRLNCWRAS